MQVIHFLHARGHTYRDGKHYWTKKFMVWINTIQLDQPGDAYVLQGDLADIVHIEARIHDWEHYSPWIKAPSRLSNAFLVYF